MPHSRSTSTPQQCHHQITSNQVPAPLSEEATQTPKHEGHKMPQAKPNSGYPNLIFRPKGLQASSTQKGNANPIKKYYVLPPKLVTRALSKTHNRVETNSQTRLLQSQSPGGLCQLHAKKAEPPVADGARVVIPGLKTLQGGQAWGTRRLGQSRALPGG